MSIRKRVSADGSRRYQVRYPGARTETFDRHEDAVTYELDCKRRARLGILYEAPPETFGVFLDGFVERKQALGRRPKTIQSLRESRKRLKELEPMLIPQLRRVDVEDLLKTIAGGTPRTAQLCHDLIMEALREAVQRGQRVDAGIFEIKRNVYERREGRLVTVEQMRLIGTFMPQTCRRLVLVAGILGMRQGELLDLLDSDLNLDDHALFIPKGKTKAARRRVELGDEIVTVLREQLLARPKKSRHVFASPTGIRWDGSNFMEDVYRPAVKKAGLEGLTFHDLRHTAISTMAIAGWRPEHIARQIGHSDGGVLIFKRYRHLFPEEMRLQTAALDELLKPKKKPAPAEEAGGA